MAVKRTSGLDQVRSQKRAKTFPLTQTGEVTIQESHATLDRSYTTPISGTDTAPARSDTSSEIETKDDEDPTCFHESQTPDSDRREDQHTSNESITVSEGQDQGEEADIISEHSSELVSVPLSPQNDDGPEAKFMVERMAKLREEEIRAVYCSDYDLPEGRTPGTSEPEPEGLAAEPDHWTAPAEPWRPPNPYIKGQNLVIQKHTACPPFGRDYPVYPGKRERADGNDAWTKTLVELCLQYPPMEGETSQDMTRKMQIVDEIRVKDDGGAQLVTCRLDEDADEYVAKIYDPLYYGFHNRMWRDLPRDVTYEADQDYCREVAAYLELDGKTFPNITAHGPFNCLSKFPAANIPGTFA